jgi:predicted Holliday junction resolvase-like endonuclease
MVQFFALVILTIYIALYLAEKIFSPKTSDSPAHESNKDFLLAAANQRIGELEATLQSVGQQEFEARFEKSLIQEKFNKLQHQKISADVKLGQKSEHLLPFLESFPYKDDEIKGLFQPIDLIVFRDDEVVFVEVKTGAAQLSEKERRIRDNIKNGRVRFEVHRINEKGVTVK